MKKLILPFLLMMISIQLNAQIGSLYWARSMGGGTNDFNEIESNLAGALTTDASGNVYTVGSFQGTVDFDPNIGIANLVSNGSDDIFIQKMDPDGILIWAKSVGGTQSDDASYISIDNSGNLLITGFFRSTVDFNPNAGVNNLTTNGSRDAFILKLDNAGNYIWAKSVGGGFTDYGRCITADASNNVVLIGNFFNTVDFDPGPSVYNLIPAGANEIFILKLDASGNFIWAKSMGGTSSDYGYTIVTDNADNIYSSGYFAGTADFDPNAGVSNLISTSANDIFIQKLDASGNLVWVNRIGGGGQDQGWDMKIDNAGDLCLTGQYQSTVDFDPGPGTFNMTAWNYDVFVLKMDTDGNFIWAKDIGVSTSSSEYVYSIDFDASNNLYITGDFEGTVDFDPSASVDNHTSLGLNDIFLTCLQSNGDYNWTETFGSTNNDTGKSVSIDPFGNILLAGFYQLTTDFDPSASVWNLTSNGLEDAFVIKFESGLGLPIELIKFEALRENRNVALTWSTASEINNDYFTIERSQDVKQWQALGTIGGAGNSINTLHYSAVDTDPHPEISYYRLKQTDFDGLNSYSSIQSVNFHATSDPAVTIYPNPTTGIVHIEGASSAQLYTITGEELIDQVWHQSSNGNHVIIDLSALPCGVYILESGGLNYRILKH